MLFGEWCPLALCSKPSREMMSGCSQMLACGHGPVALWWVRVGPCDVVRLPTSQKEAVHSLLSFRCLAIVCGVETSQSEARWRWRIPSMNLSVMNLQRLPRGCWVGFGVSELKGSSSADLSSLGECTHPFPALRFVTMPSLFSVAYGERTVSYDLAPPGCSPEAQQH